ncbi:MAG: ATP synthase F1 subunit epsilon [Saprospiraceae bacterium]
MDIAVLTPDKEIFSGEITSVKVPGVSGQFEILSNHAPLVSALTEGEVRILKKDGQKMNFTIEKGFLEVLNNSVSLLVQGLKE